MASIHHPHARRPRDAFAENPIQTLRRDHDMIRKLADKYRNGHSPEVRQQAATQLLRAVHTHSRLEEAVFYPGVRKIEPNLVAHFEEDHLNVDDMLAALEDMRMDDAHAQAMLNGMIDAVLDHIREEEDDFFPLLELANLDLSAVALEMQVFEANLVHMQAQFGGRGVRH
jgi:hemerythrin superfamily protein